MAEIINSWFARFGDTITFWIALLGFFMSSATWVFTWWNRRVKIEIVPDKQGEEFGVGERELIGYTVDGSRSVVSITLPCFYINRSGTSIAITQIVFVSSKGREYRAELSPSFAFYKFHKMIDTPSVYERFSETTKFPLNLGPLQAEYSSFLVMLPSDAEITCAKIFTNRKKLKDAHLASTVNSILQEKKESTIKK